MTNIRYEYWQILKILANTKKILANLKNDGQGGEARSQLHDGHPAHKEGKLINFLEVLSS